MVLPLLRPFDRQQIRYRLRGDLVYLAPDVLVGVACDHSRGVPEDLLNDLDVKAASSISDAAVCRAL